ncbi:MAG: hypothetical protein AAFR26_02145 [Cyanobacteria bacterium J06626_4]
MSKISSFYAVYMSSLAIEVHNQNQLALARGRCICKQSNYTSILRFARNLAQHHQLPLCNYAQIEA